MTTPLTPPHASHDLLSLLVRDGRASPAATLTPLTGGVSSDIWVVRDAGRHFVVKRALTKLKVAADWYADPRRNATEYAYLRYVAAIDPNAVPAVIGPLGDGYFCMAYLGEAETWKTALLAGQRDPTVARNAGALLGKIHAHSATDPAAASTFATLANFEQLRIEPYLLATAQKHPDLLPRITAEANRLRSAQNVLCHGDFSPKNLLVQKSGNVVAVDCEVAWFGDAAFDVGFLLNHLFLKTLARRAPRAKWAAMIDAAWSAYVAARGPAAARQVEHHLLTLLPLLMLARVDGKSPAEYLDPPQQQIVRTFARAAALGPGATSVQHLFTQWLDAVEQAEHPT